MHYLTVGTSEITRDLFRKVENAAGDNMKPRGGLWLTIYNELYDDYNEWVDYLLEDSTAFYYKSRNYNGQNYSMWNQPCSLVTLKDDANIYVLDSKEKLDSLREKHPIADGKFSYIDMSQIYDGIFVDMNKLLCSVSDGAMRSKICKFGVNSLVLFNLDCIDYYQSGVVSITPFDFEYAAYEGTQYKIKIDDTKKKILK